MKNNKMNKILVSSILCILVAGCNPVTSSSFASSIENSSSIETSSTDSSSISEESSNFSSSNEVEKGTYIVNGEIIDATKWGAENAIINYNDGINVAPIDNTYSAKITLKHISLLKDKIYNLSFTASGNSILKLSLLNKGNEDVTKGLNTSYTLTENTQNFELVFGSGKDYSNVYIILESDSEFNFSSLILNRHNLFGDYEAPRFSGVENSNVFIWSEFDYALNVTVNDNIDGNLTSKYQVELPDNINVNGTKVTFNAPGDYTFIYTCSDNEDNVARVERVITVFETVPSGHEFIKNGSFDYGLNLWYHDAYNGAEGSFDVVEENNNNVLKASITTLPSAGSHQPFPRLLYGKLGAKQMTDELVIEQGCSYTLSFRMKASKARTIQVLVGEILDQQDAQGNWTYYFAQEPETYGWGLNERSVTTEWQNYTITFAMALNYTNYNGCVAFCFGDTSNPQIGDIYLDDVSLVKN